MNTEGIMQETLDRLKERRAELQSVVDEYEINEQLIGDVEEMVTIIAEPVVPVPKKAPAKKRAAKPSIPLATIAPPGVTSLADKRASKSSKHSAAGKKGGRPTKKATFLKLLKTEKEIDRAEIPALIDTTVARVNEFVPELVREGLVRIDDKDDNHGPEYVVITEKGMSA